MSSLELRDAGGRTTAGARSLAPFSDVVRSGEWLGLIGPNGAGKSSLLRAVVGLVEATGDVLVDGASLALRAPPAAGRARGLRAAVAGDARRHDRLRVRAARPLAVHRLLRHREPPRQGDGAPTCSSGSSSSGSPAGGSAR